MEPFEQFAERIRPRLVEWLKRRFQFDESRAEDVAQTALLQATVANKKPHFVDEKHREAWTFNAARCRALDIIKGSRELTGAEEEINGRPDPHDSEITKAEAVIAGCDVEQLRAAMRQLKPAEYDILYLAYYEDYSINDLAEYYRVTQSAADSRERRALAHLKELLICTTNVF